MTTPEQAPARPSILAMTPCPAWCTSSHANGDSDHLGEITVIRGFRNRPDDQIIVRPAHILPASDSTRPEVLLSGNRWRDQGEAPATWLDPETAVTVARLAEMLAGATAAQHRTLATALRAAAAALTADGGAR